MVEGEVTVYERSSLIVRAIAVYYAIENNAINEAWAKVDETQQRAQDIMTVLGRICTAYQRTKPWSASM